MIKSKFYDNSNDFGKVTKIYTLRKYSRTNATEDEFIEVEKYFKFLTEKTRYKLGTLKYIKYKYILGKLYSINFTK